MLLYIFNKTESDDVIRKDAEIFFSPVLLIMNSESNTLKTKALSLLNIFLSTIKKQENDQMDSSLEDEKNAKGFIESLDSLVKTYWSKLEPNKLFISLNIVAKQRPELITSDIKELIVKKVEETASKFRYNVELKNTLFTFFEYLDGDRGKMFLNERLGSLWY
jgi:hypothetical protein